MIEARPYHADDAEAFIDLYRECLGYYRVRAATEAQESRILKMLEDERHMSCLIAVEGNIALGFATWVLTVPAGSDVALYMKELFVSEGARGRGVGRALMAALVRIAEAEGCCRVDWQTDKDNPESQAFYAQLEAPVFDKVSYRVHAEEYQAFLSRLEG
ncbi:MAG: GNAT family N-acetyltransferase [Pseudomonadota bacterium]